MRKVGNNVEVVFPSLKNNQMYEGQKTMMAANETNFCPDCRICSLGGSVSKWLQSQGIQVFCTQGSEREGGTISRRPGGGQWHKSEGGTAAFAAVHGCGQAGCDRPKMLRVTKTLEAGCSSGESGAAWQMEEPGYAALLQRQFAGVQT
jgi:hypothetical protein